MVGVFLLTGDHKGRSYNSTIKVADTINGFVAAINKIVAAGLAPAVS